MRITEQAAPESAFKDFYDVLIKFNLIDPREGFKLEVHGRAGGISAIKFPTYEKILV